MLCVKSSILTTHSDVADLSSRGPLRDHRIERREGLGHLTSESLPSPMFCDFPTLQTIKQVAKCPLGNGPDLVRGRFLSLREGAKGKQGSTDPSRPWLPAGPGLRDWGRSGSRGET